METKLKIHNRFDFELIKADGTTITAQAENVVLNQVYNMYNGLGEVLESSYAYSRFVNICLGTGTGTPAVTDTRLFTQLYVSRVSTDTYDLLADGITKQTWTLTVPETAAIGQLTEVGLMAEYGRYRHPAYVLMTHALITDSEGNPITIDKTSADILNITATAYFKLTAPSGYSVVRGDFYQYNLNNAAHAGELAPADTTATTALPGAIMSSGHALYAQFTPLANVTSSNTAGFSFRFFGISKPCAGYNDYAHSVVRMSPNSTNANANSELMRCTSSAVDSTAGNLTGDVTYLIKGILTPGDFWIAFPNHTIYPPKQLTLTVTGDGVTTDFNLPVPELMTTSVTVSINGVTQDPSTYQFYGKNFEMKQAWCTFDTRYVVQTGCKYYAAGSGDSGSMTFLDMRWPCVASDVWDAVPSTVYTTQDPRVYDFGTAKTVNTFKTTTYAPDWSSITVKLEYSSDGETWTTAASLPANAAGTQTFTPISARYWRLVDLPAIYTSIVTPPGKVDQIPFGFDEVLPTIRFTNAPADQATIEITCYCEYPMKNSNWRVDSLVSDIKYTRDNS